jgi:hypothetical protein
MYSPDNRSRTNREDEQDRRLDAPLRSAAMSDEDHGRRYRASHLQAPISMHRLRSREDNDGRLTSIG